MTKKNIILAIVIIVLLGGVAWYFMQGSRDNTNSNSSLVSENKSSSVVVTDEGAKILNTLNKVKSITLNIGFLSSAAYSSLKESNVEILTQTIGRENPFAPVSFDGKVIATKATTTKNR